MPVQSSRMTSEIGQGKKENTRPRMPRTGVPPDERLDLA
jgi:hypothetical protein